jgi:hypothetical protein
VAACRRRGKLATEAVELMDDVIVSGTAIMGVSLRARPARMGLHGSGRKVSTGPRGPKCCADVLSWSVMASLGLPVVAMLTGSGLGHSAAGSLRGRPFTADVFVGAVTVAVGPARVLEPVAAGLTVLLLMVPGGLAASWLGFTIACKAAAETGRKSSSRRSAAQQQPGTVADNKLRHHY